MNQPGRAWQHGKFQSVLKWLALGVVVLWLVRFLGGGFRRGPELPASGSGLFLLAVGLVLGGLVLWKMLTVFFWRKYFPTQNPPEPPEELGKRGG